MLRIRNAGVPVVGFTWYSLTDQIDWDTALREDNGRVNPRGLYDLDRKPRAVGVAFRRLIEDWCRVLPTQSVCLQVPLELDVDVEVRADGEEGPRRGSSRVRRKTRAGAAGRRNAADVERASGR